LPSRFSLGLRFLASAMIVGLAFSVGAQNPTSSLRGTVADSSGAVVQGAQVSLLDSQNGFAQSRSSEDRPFSPAGVRRPMRPRNPASSN